MEKRRSKKRSTRLVRDRPRIQTQVRFRGREASLQRMRHRDSNT